MEAVGYIGGALTLAGLMAFLAQLRRKVPTFKLGTGLVVLGLAMVGAAYYVTSRPATAAVTYPVPVAVPSAQGSVSVPAVVVPAWSTYDQFLALSSSQQTVVIQQAMDSYDKVSNEASTTLNASLLPQVASGAHLAYLEQLVAKQKQAGTPSGGDFKNLVTSVTPQKPPLSLVVAHVQGTERSWWLDPKTLSPGPPSVNQFNETVTFTLEGGVWKLLIISNVS